MTSPIVGPSATASENEKNGIPRFAFTEPSIGSTTTLLAPPAPNARSPSSSETSTKSSLERGEPLDDGVLGRLIDRCRVVAALARPEHRLALHARGQSLEHVADVRDAQAARSRARASRLTGWKSSPESGFG